MTEIDPIVIVAAARTPIGGFQGDFKDLAAANLGAVAVACPEADEPQAVQSSVAMTASPPNVPAEALLRLLG